MVGVQLHSTLGLVTKSSVAGLNDLDDPLQSRQTDRTPLTGNAQSQSSRTPISQSYLTSSIPGEDRRAPNNTLDESVWETLSRDLRAVWEKMKLVLWPNNLLGGILSRGGRQEAAERGEADSLAGSLRGIAGRLGDADTVLQGGMTEGLRDWDLWYARMAKSSIHQPTDLLLGVRFFSVSF